MNFNFLQKGLAGLESRLDKVLLDDPTSTPATVVTAQPQKMGMGMGIGVESVRRSMDSGRSSIQERLAAAVAAKSGRSSPSTVKQETPPPPPQPQVSAAVAVAAAPPPAPPPPPLPPPDIEQVGPELDEIVTNGDTTTPDTPEIHITPDDDDGTDGELVALPPHELLALISQLRTDLTTCETRRQEEAHDASERIDALSAKLQYLSAETAAAARERAAASTAIPAEKRLAERDEKIALLIEEGERLSRNELKLQTTIKKLRLQAKEAGEARKKTEAAERALREEREKVKKLGEAEKRTVEKAKAFERVEREVEGLRREKEALEVHVEEGRVALLAQRRRAEEAEGKVQTEALEAERRNTIELQAQVERAQSEAAMKEKMLRGEVADLRNKMERVREKARAREAELKAEQSVMESKMEALRARLEEASSGSTGDAHAKLLRQVETLQTQYAIASENWQVIKGSLLAGVASLEKERDDLAKKEGDIRRKAREMSLKYKALESSLEAARSKLKDLESDLTSAHELTSNLRSRLTATESSAAAARANFERELDSRLHEEREKWIAQSASTPIASTPTTLAPPRAPTIASATESYFLGFNPHHPPRKLSAPRSMSAEPPLACSQSGFHTPPIRSDPFPTSASRTSLSAAADMDDFYFDNSATPSSPHRHPDLVSVSTVAAGPSVQLIERMSAAVRRLESEMAGSHEELARVQGQRDEGRKEIVELMREVEVKRAAEECVERLESEMEEMRVRMETTLELLGEKTERVEELTQDVEDLKDMYRELVLTTSGK